MDILLKPGKITLLFSLAVLFLTLANVAGLALKFHFGHGSVYGLVPLFDVNREANIPSTYSFLSLLFCSALLAIISSAKREAGASYARHWLALAVIFFFLSIDEAAEIHEQLSRPVKEILSTSGPYYVAWVIPYVVVLLFLIFLYLRFFASLPARTRWSFVIAGLLFLSGAVGVEILEPQLTKAGSKETFVFAALSSIEELLEMAGVVVFIHALASYIDSEFKQVLIRITSGRTSDKESR